MRLPLCWKSRVQFVHMFRRFDLHLPVGLPPTPEQPVIPLGAVECLDVMLINDPFPRAPLVIAEPLDATEVQIQNWEALNLGAPFSVCRKPRSLREDFPGVDA